MSRNQQPIWHNTHQQDILSATPAHLELVPEKASNLEQSTTETLRRTQEELLWHRRLYENMPSVYFTLDVTGTIVSVNQFGANCLGYAPEQLINEPVFNLFDQSDQQRLSDAFIGLLKDVPKSEVTNWEFRLNCPTSNILWVKVVAQILPIEGHFIGEGNQRKLATLPYLSEKATTVRESNATVYKGTTIATTEETLASHCPQKNLLILMVCEDITDYKQAEVALQQIQEAARSQLEEIESLNHLKDEFLNTVSHELRTPLTNMKMAIQMLGITLDQEQNFLAQMAKPQVERSKAARYFQILDNECEREINLIDNFLDLHRLDPRSQPWVLEKIKVQQWLWQVVELFKARNCDSCQQKLYLNIASDIPPLACNPCSLERIFIELLTNASKFSPSDADITVTAQLKTQNIQFQVINSGVEIPTSELTRIFDKFYRIPSNDPGKQGGTGLGLALVQKLTKHLGGTIEVESESNRTCFTIQLALNSKV